LSSSTKSMVTVETRVGSLGAWNQSPIQHLILTNFNWLHTLLGSWDSSVSMETRQQCGCLHLHSEDEGSKVLWKAGILPHHYMASQLWRPWLESSALWKTSNLSWTKLVQSMSQWIW
jgi:hypothetical protein